MHGAAILAQDNKSWQVVALRAKSVRLPAAAMLVCPRGIQLAIWPPIVVSVSCRLIPYLTPLTTISPSFGV